MFSPRTEEDGIADTISVGIVGDYDLHNPTHTATQEALEHAGASLGVPITAEWLPTNVLRGRASETLRRFDSVFSAPGSPYWSLDGRSKRSGSSARAASRLSGRAGGSSTL